MKLLAGWAVSAGLVPGLILLASAANAQAPAPLGADRSPYSGVSDFGGPYGAPLPAPPPYAAPFGSEGPYRYAPELLPPREIYAVLHDNGFAPLGPPHRRGYFYEISAIDPDGEDGRLIIDGRTGRIMRFMPAYWGDRSENFEMTAPYGAQAALPPPILVRGVPRPPAPIPHVARRAVLRPAPRPTMAVIHEKPPERAPHAAVEKSNETSVQPQRSEAAAPPATTGTIGESKPPQPQIRPTEPMPPVQGLE